MISCSLEPRLRTLYHQSHVAKIPDLVKWRVRKYETSVARQKRSELGWRLYGIGQGEMVIEKPGSWLDCGSAPKYLIGAALLGSLL